MKKLMLWLINFYGQLVSPYLRTFVGGGCKYEINCSRFAYQSIEKHGLRKGGTIAMKRLINCNF